MLDSLKRRFNELVSLEKTSTGEAANRELQIATGVLLLEMAGADNDYAPEEVKSCFQTLERQFGISDSEALELLEKAEEIRTDKEKISEYVTQLNTQFTVEQRQLILALVWKIVVADEKIEKFELQLANQLRVRLQLTEAQSEEARKLAFAGNV